MSYLNEMFRRIRHAWAWVGAQFWATLLIVLAGVGWTRVPEKHAWQVGITLLLPLVIVAALLVLQAGTIRKLFGLEERRTHFAISALTLLAWIAVVWIAWAILDWCDDQTWLWANYLNSRASAHVRSKLFTYEHFQLWLTILIWIARWIVVPAKVIPHALASAQWGWRLPCRKLLRVLLNWRWWLGVTIAALIGVLLPSYFFHGEPHGTVAHQVSAVTLKLAGAYLLAIVSWVLLLAWAAVLVARQPDPAMAALDQELLTRIWAGRRWIAGLAGWRILWSLSDHWAVHQQGTQVSADWLTALLALFFLASLLILIAGVLRSLIGPTEKRIRMISAAAIIFVWALFGLAAAILLSVRHASLSADILCWVLIPGILIPLAAATAVWGLRSSWLKALGVLANWRWWLGILAAVIVGVAIPAVLSPNPLGSTDPSQGDLLFLREAVSFAFILAGWVALLGWCSALLTRSRRRPGASGEDSLQLAPAVPGTPQSGTAKLPLPESNNDARGNV